MKSNPSSLPNSSFTLNVPSTIPPFRDYSRLKTGEDWMECFGLEFGERALKRESHPFINPIAVKCFKEKALTWSKEEIELLITNLIKDKWYVYKSPGVTSDVCLSQASDSSSSLASRLHSVSTLTLSSSSSSSSSLSNHIPQASSSSSDSSSSP